MQYFLRFYLSCTVVMSHLWANAFGGSGSYAVCGFYVISGYVITMVLQKRYLVIEHGLKKFWINRFLRLYPTFFTITVFGYIVTRLAPIEADSLVGLALPESAKGKFYIETAGMPAAWPALAYIPNFTMLGLQLPVLWSAPVSFAPTAWSTNVELYYYLVLSLGAAASFKNAFRFFIIALGLASILPVIFILHEAGQLQYGSWYPGFYVSPFGLFYRTFLGWSFFFAVGCLSYFRPKLRLPTVARLALLAICLGFPFVYASNPYAMITLRMCFGIVAAMTLMSFSDDRGQPLIRFLGDLSYPLFLIHWPTAILVSYLTGMPKNGPLFLACSLTLSIALSSAIVMFVERPIELFRWRNRS
jgi:peptidoglycan/LPS O-acetylase OafA/YrhL